MIILSGTYKGRNLRITPETSISGANIYRYYVDSYKGVAYSSYDNALDAAHKYIDRNPEV